MLLHVTNEPLDRSHPESKDIVRHETILGKILFKKDFYGDLSICCFQGGWEIPDDSGDDH